MPSNSPWPFSVLATRLRTHSSAGYREELAGCLPIHLVVRARIPHSRRSAPTPLLAFGPREGWDQTSPQVATRRLSDTFSPTYFFVGQRSETLAAGFLARGRLRRIFKNAFEALASQHASHGSIWLPRIEFRGAGPTITALEDN